jgi:hypothetical protein
MCGNGEASANQYTSRGLRFLKAGAPFDSRILLRWRDPKKPARPKLSVKNYMSEKVGEPGGWLDRLIRWDVQLYRGPRKRGRNK